MEKSEIVLKKGGGDPEIEFLMGHAHYGKYEALLWKSGSVRVVGKGVNVDDIPDKFSLLDKDNNEKLKDIDKSVLSWEILIASYSPEPDQTYSASVSITQKGQHVKGSPFQYSGKLAPNSAQILGHVRLLVL